MIELALANLHRIACWLALNGGTKAIRQKDKDSHRVANANVVTFWKGRNMSGKTRQVEAAISALAGGCSQAEAARRAGVAERTVSRWLARDEFQRRLAKARARVLDGVVNQLTVNAELAVQTLRELLVDLSPAIRLGAARATLDSLLKLRAEVDVEQRLAAIESKLK